MTKLLAAVVFLSSVALAKPAPLFKAEALGGKTISLSDTLKSDRGVLVLFWASWCTPCLEELKSVADYMKAHPEFPLDVLTVNVDTSETNSDVAPTVKLYGIKFPVLLDPNHEIFGKYQAAKQLPYSVLVSGKGQLELSFQGYQPELFTHIAAALKGTDDSKKN